MITIEVYRSRIGSFRCNYNIKMRRHSHPSQQEIGNWKRERSKLGIILIMSLIVIYASYTGYYREYSTAHYSTASDTSGGRGGSNTSDTGIVHYSTV